jgi:hypothetical protein
LLKGCAPANGSLFDKGRIVSGDGEIGEMAQWWIVEKPACDEFLIIELMGIPGQESLDGVVGREAGL